MSDYSQIITLANLNTVYEDIRHRIDALGDVYSPKGSETCAKLNGLLNTSSTSKGDVYNVSDDGYLEGVEGSFSVDKNSNVVCVEVTVDNSIVKKWAKLGGIYELANNTTAGLVFLGEKSDFSNDEANKTITGIETGHTELGLNMGIIDEDNPETDSSSYRKTYVKVPFASDKIYGLVSTEEQTFSGNKTFKSSSNSDYSVTIKTVNGSTATSEIEIANKSESASTIITPTSISVGGNGSTATGRLTISSGNTVANSAEFGTLKVNGTATVAKEATFNGNLNVITTDESGNTTGGDVTANSLITTNIYPKNATADATKPYLKTDIITTDSLVAANIGTENDPVDVVFANTLDATSNTVTVNTQATTDELHASVIQNVEYAYMNTLNAPDATVSVSSSQIGVDSLYVKAIQADKSTGSKITAAYIGILNATGKEVTVDAQATVSNLYATDIGTSNSRVSTVYANTLDAADKKVTVETQATVSNLYATNIGTSSDPVGTVYANELKGTSGGNCNLNVANINVIDGANTVSLTYTNDVPNSRDTAFKDNNTQGLTCNKNFGVAGHIYAYKVHNAVWNDLADAIEIGIKPEPGYCYSFDGEKYNKSTKYCDKGFIGIHSDTFGMIMGEKGSETELNVALAGFVLAYVDKEYPAGTPLTCTKEGYLTKIKKKDLIFRSQRIVATYWKSESKDKWNGVEVNNRCWVKVR